jgi:hypothetical protein
VASAATQIASSLSGEGNRKTDKDAIMKELATLSRVNKNSIDLCAQILADRSIQDMANM